MTPIAAAKNISKFDPKTFLSTLNGGRKIVAFPKKRTIFAQCDSSDAVFYLKEGRVKLTVVSKWARATGKVGFSNHIPLGGVVRFRDMCGARQICLRPLSLPDGLSLLAFLVRSSG